MADRERLYEALRNADAAGDTQAAKRLAEYIRQSDSSPAKQEKFDPTEGMSTGQKFLAGVGKTFYDFGRGAGQFIPVRRDGEWSTLVTEEDVKRANDLDRPLMNTTAGFVGNLAGNVALTAPTMLIPGANTARGAALIGAATGLLQPAEEMSDKVVNAGFGAAVGYGGQKTGEAVGKLLGGSRNAQAYNIINTKPGKSAAGASVQGSVNASAKGGGSTLGTVDPTDVGGLNRAQQASREAGERLGFRLTPGQASGSRSLQQMEARMESQPMFSGPFNRIKDQNQAALNRVVAKSIGENADVVDNTVLSSADERIGRIYKMIASDRKTPIDPDDFLGRLQSIEAEYEGLLPTSITETPLVKRLFSYAGNGEATKKQLQDLGSKINKAAYNQMTSANGDRQLGMALYDVKNIVDDYLETGLSGDTLKQFREARQQYRTLMTLMKNQGVVNASSGNVSGPVLANTLARTDKKGFMMGRNNSDLYEAARFAQAFRPIVGDSGTATRSMPTSPLEFVMAVPFGAAASAYTSSPIVNLASGVSAGLAPNAVNPFVIKRLAQGGALGSVGLLNAAQE